MANGVTQSILHSIASTFLQEKNKRETNYVSFPQTKCLVFFQVTHNLTPILN